MFNNQKINYTALFLLFCVASSKGIIIYNEEILVALSFALFVMFCLSYFGNTVKESLDERSSTIRFQLEDFHRLKEDSLQQLLSLHKRIKEAKKIFPSLSKDQLSQLSYTSTSESQTVELHNRFCEQVQQKLMHFQSSKAVLQQDLQKSIALTITFFVIAKSEKAKRNKKLSSQIKQGLASLKV